MEKQKGLAIITGASQGIGAVIAAGLAKSPPRKNFLRNFQKGGY